MRPDETSSLGRGRTPPGTIRCRRQSGRLTRGDDGDSGPCRETGFLVHEVYQVARRHGVPIIGQGGIASAAGIGTAVIKTHAKPVAATMRKLHRTPRLLLDSLKMTANTRPRPAIA